MATVICCPDPFKKAWWCWRCSRTQPSISCLWRIASVVNDYLPQRQGSSYILCVVQLSGMKCHPWPMGKSWRASPAPELFMGSTEVALNCVAFLPLVLIPWVLLTKHVHFHFRVCFLGTHHLSQVCAYFCVWFNTSKILPCYFIKNYPFKSLDPIPQISSPDLFLGPSERFHSTN